VKYLIKFVAIIGLVSMSHVVIAIDNVSDGDILTAIKHNALINAANANTFYRLADDDGINNIPDNGGLTEGPVDPLTPAPDRLCDTTAIGDTGPGGGLIFLLTADGCRGLEASESDIAAVAGASTGFGCDTDSAGAFGLAYGDGRKNTGYILAAMCTDGTEAADLVHAYRGGGRDDWYLPALQELGEMYAEIGPGADNAGGFNESAVYWTSTEDESNRPTNAWSVDFADGRVFSSLKTSILSVRAVRVFDVTP
jgi:hypothetical protein